MKPLLFSLSFLVDPAFLKECLKHIAMLAFMVACIVVGSFLTMGIPIGE